jgi:S1-C subfamily serine protease
MAEKQSLYELFGLSDKASPDDVQRAFAEHRAALETLPEGEEKHNRIAILTDARDVLLDRRQRAGYDRRQRDRRTGGRRKTDATAQGPGAKSVALALLLCAGLGYIAWHSFVAPPPPPVAAVSPAPTPAASASTGGDAEPIAADVAALLPPKPADSSAQLPPPSSPAVAANQGEPAVRPLSDSPQANTVRTIGESTYAIVGGAGFGTGVAIERDKLLTNCHVIAPNVHKGPLYAISAVTGARTVITEAAFLITEDACVAHAPGLNAKPLPIGNAAQLARGAPIYSVGFAAGRLGFSAGILLGVINRHGQNYLVSSNFCDQGISGGPLVDAEGRLVGLTSGGPRDRSFCLSLTAETARRVLDQTLIAIDGFPTDYLTNLRRRW